MVASALMLFPRSIRTPILLRVKYGSFYRICPKLERNYVGSKPGADAEQELAEARKWLSTFSPNSIPQRLCDISFSRSSGPGGQNVNKVNSKATLRLGLSSISNLFPPLILAKIRSSPATARYITNNDEIVVQSDRYRTQNDNVDDCLNKVYRAIVDAADLPGETSVEQKNHVAHLKQKENANRLKSKKFRSSKKSSRRDKGDF